jgi:hypothetical protein
MGLFKHKTASAMMAAAQSQTSANNNANVANTSYIAPVHQEEQPPPSYADQHHIQIMNGAAALHNASLRGYNNDHREMDLENPKSTDDFSENEPCTPRHRAEPTKQNNHLNSLFNGHLMKWKMDAEEGSAFIRVPAFFGGLGLMATAIAALVLYPEAWMASSIVMSIGVILMSLFIIILDGRFLASNPLSARAHLRNVMTRNFNIFRFVWGRGLLYIVAGILNCSQMWLITICSGAFMIGVGVLALCVGVHASRKFASLRNSLADESLFLFELTNKENDCDC